MFATLVLAAPLSFGAAPVDLRSFPLDPVGHDPTTALPRFLTREGELGALQGLQNLTLTDVPLPVGGVQLDLERLDLDAMGFAPVGKITKGWRTVKSLYSGYGEGAPMGFGPSQSRLQDEGNAYLEANYPRLDYIERAVLE